MTREFIDFVKAHLTEDTSRLLLSAARYPSIDMYAAVQQIEGLRTAREKWPSLLQYDEFRYPPRLNREQSSSEQTAKHKVDVVKELCYTKRAITIADLTGGMGIDSLAFAQEETIETKVDYVELHPELCTLMDHNRQALGIDNLTIHQGDSLTWLAETNRTYDIIYIDPARRSSSGRKVTAFEDCEPNILHQMPLLLSHCRWLMVKASPMIDLHLAQTQLGKVSQVHIISVKGECKEVLFVCGDHDGETAILCTTIQADGTHVCTFTPSQEATAEPVFCTHVKSFLYEPDAALMKGGPFNLLCQWTGMEKLARNTHLYTDDRYPVASAGRTFHVLKEIKLTRKEIASVIPSGKAHVVTRNYPVDAATLQRQLGLKEGGDLFIVATTVGLHKTAFLCCQPGEDKHFL